MKLYIWEWFSNVSVENNFRNSDMDAIYIQYKNIRIKMEKYTNIHNVSSLSS